MTHPLTALFIDCDSYFASVEQHLDPALRGRPVGVAPVLAESSCCIAASYEAKAYGVKTGTRVSDARHLCPDITIVESKPAEYIHYHHRIIEAVENCIHVEAVLSIDEMWAALPLNRRSPADISRIAQHIKATIAESVSPVIRVSIGAAPNKFLAKLASKMRKPNGFFVIHAHELPECLYELKLRDITGIGRQMELRLNAAGIYSVQDLCSATKPTLHTAWNGISGDRLWHLLRGDEIPDLVSARKSISHSHVLPPDLRPPEHAWPILCKLLHKAAERLRSHGLVTSSLSIHLAFLRNTAWAAEIRCDETDSTIQLMRMLHALWDDRPEPQCPLLQVAIQLNHLKTHDNFTPSLFQYLPQPPALDLEKQRKLDATIDQLRARYGRNVVFFGNVHNAREEAPMRISFTHIPNPKLEQDSQQPRSPHQKKNP